MISVWENKEANFGKVEALIAKAGLPANSLVVLPEMFATGFSFNLPLTAENPDGITESFLKRIAKENEIYVVGGLITRSGSEATNQAVLFSPRGDRIARYSKIFPFSGEKENLHHAPGKGTVCCSCDEFRTALFVCYDLRFPEIFRVAARQGAELLIVISNWPVKRVQHWITLLQARAIENQAYVVGVNRAGQDPQFVYPGRSIIVDPHGNIMTDAGPDECLVTADIDVANVRNWRRDFPALRDLRPEFLPLPHGFLTGLR